MTSQTLTDSQQKVADVLREDDIMPVREIAQVTGLAPATVNRALSKLEQMGLALRYFNGHGPQTPWWWEAPPAPNPENRQPVEVGQIYDWGRTQDLTWVQIVREPGEASVLCDVRAGEHNTVRCYLPLSLWDGYQMGLRVRGEVTQWSSQFHCPTHGECTDEMVKTDKTCSLCGSLLNRV